MYVYLVQHGKAKSAEEDPNRGLSDEGRNEIQRVAEFLSELRITVSLIQHSGKTRLKKPRICWPKASVAPPVLVTCREWTRMTIRL